MFNDIAALKDERQSFHFMATIVGLKRDIQSIVVDEYVVTEVVDGQQRLTTLIVLLKSIEKMLDESQTEQYRLKKYLQDLLVKQDNLSLILLQTNHDSSEYFKDYLRSGSAPDSEEAETIADKEILSAIHESEAFVDSWEDRIELLRIVLNKLTFESPRLSRRLHFLRGWSHEQANEIFPGSPGTGGASGLRA